MVRHSGYVLENERSYLVLKLSGKTCSGRKVTIPTPETCLATQLLPWLSNADLEMRVVYFVIPSFVVQRVTYRSTSERIRGEVSQPFLWWKSVSHSLMRGSFLSTRVWMKAVISVGEKGAGGCDSDNTRTFAWSQSRPMLRTFRNVDAGCVKPHWGENTTDLDD